MGDKLSKYFNSKDFYETIYEFYAINDRLNLAEVLKEYIASYEERMK